MVNVKDEVKFRNGLVELGRNEHHDEISEGTRHLSENEQRPEFGVSQVGERKSSENEFSPLRHYRKSASL